MAIAEVSIVPVGTEDASVSSYITACYRVLEKETGLKHQLTPMSTIIEGDLDKVLEAVKRMHQVPFREGAHRVVTSVTIDERKDKPLTMEKTVGVVMAEL